MGGFHVTILTMNAVLPRKLQIVVLAAGFSSRMGRPKLLARIHGVSLLRRTLKAVSSPRSGQIIAVVPRNAARYRCEALGMKVRWVMNARRAQGLSSSVRRGIAAARYAPAILLLPADLMHLKNRDLLKLARRWQCAPRRLIARRIGLAGAAPVILPRWLFARASGLAGDVGLRELIRQLPVASRILVDMPSAASDVDTLQDLKGARRSFRRPSG